MAISGGDGSIILTTKVDQTGIKKGLSSITKGFKVVAVAAATATVAITKMAVSAYADYEQLIGGVETLFKNSADKVKAYAENAFATAGLSANEYMQNVTAFSASLISSLGGDTEKAADVANQAIISIADNVNKMGSDYASVQNAFQGFAKQQYMLLDNLKLGYGGTKTEMERLLKDAEAYRASMGETVDYEISNLADVYTAIADIQEKLGIAGTTAEEAEKTISGSAAMMKASWQNLVSAIAGGGDIDKAMNNFVYSVQTYFRNIVPVVERALQGIGVVIERVAPMLVQTVARALIKAIPSLLNAIYQMIIGLGKGIYQGIIDLFSKEEEKIFEKQVNEIDKSVESQNNLKKAIKETNKEAKKSLAAFDEINILTQETTNNAEAENTSPVITTSGGGGSVGSGVDGSPYEQEISETLLAIMGTVAVAMVAIGLILLFTGNIGSGVGYIIKGAALLGVTMGLASAFGYDGIINMLTTIMGIAGGALLALGIILLWIGGVVGKPVAIGMIIAGAALIVGAVAAKAAFAPEDIKGWLSIIMGIAGGALLALGIILCMVGSVPLGVGLIIAGAVSLVSAFAINSNTIVELLQGPIGTIVMLVSTLTLVIGIILACTGAVLPLAIGLIAVGAVGLASTVALNWNTIPEKITKFFQDNAWIMAGVSLVLLIIGIILCFTPMLALGIGLIAAGAVSLGATVALNWKAITTAISDFFKNNAGLVVGISLALLVLGIILLVTGVGIPLGIGLVAAGAAGLATTVALNWDTIKEKVTTAFNKTIEWVKGWGLLVLGIILVISGVGIPLGIALMKKGGANLTEAQDPLWTAIVDRVKETWNAIKIFWNTHIAKWFTKEHWAGLAKKMMNGLIEKIEAGLNKILTKFHNANLGKAIDFIAGGLGFDIPKSITIPRLAKGAVIPPNREFLAVLGDQKQGMNIEAPLQTIVDAFNIALAQNGNTCGGNTEVVLEIDGREFGRAVVEQGNRENRRIGTRLVIA